MLGRTCALLALFLFVIDSARATLGVPDQQHYLWLADGRPAPQAQVAMRTLAEARLHGVGRDYEIERLGALYEQASRGDGASAVEFEAALTAGTLQLMRDMRPADFAPMDGAAAGADAAYAALLEAHREDRLEALLAGLAPRHPQYALLMEALRRYEALSATPQPAPIGPGPKLARGDSGERVARLRLRLLGADGAGPQPDPGHFDEALEQAVAAYQAAQGLQSDGVVGPVTLRHLDLSVGERIALIKLNMERWRRLPVDLGDDYVHVNIPEYRLRFHRAREEQLSMRVVVGTKANPTPELSDAIEYLVFNPYWHVPYSIAKRELLPEFAQDASYIEKHNYEVLLDGRPIAAADVDWEAVRATPGLPYKIRQKPGSNNALGAVKFVFPNPEHVYLHDSPAKSLYAQSRRAFSHGCIRVESPELLARALLADLDGWEPPLIDSAIASGKMRQVNLAGPVPVYLTYFSVWVAEDGTVAFFDDVYGRDAKLLHRYL